MKVRRYFLTVLLMLVCTNSHSLLLTPDNYLDVYFTPGALPAPNIDVFNYSLYGIGIQEQGLLSASLFIDNQLISTYTDLTQGYSRGFRFVSSTSLFSFGNPQVIDIDLLRNDTYSGMFKIHTDVGQFIIDPYFSNISVGISTAYNSYFYNTSWKPPVITNAEVTPFSINEPPITLLLFAGLISIISIRLIMHRNLRNRSFGTLITSCHIKQL